MILMENDIIEFKNGSRKYYHSTDEWIIKEFYDENLNCLKKDELSIVRILRPKYEEIWKVENQKQNKIKL